MTSDSGTIFNAPADQAEPSVQPDVKPAEAPQNSDPYTDLLKTVTTEDGRQKYATVSDALNSIPHAQSHIATLEKELNDYRSKFEAAQEELQKKASLTETVSRVSSNSQPSQPATEVSEDKLVGLVDQVLSQREKQSLAKTNVSQVVNELTAKFGNSQAAEAAYNAKAAELGITVDMLNNIASTSPKAVFAYFGIQQGASAPRKTDGGSINTAAMPSNPPTERGKSPLLTGNQKDLRAEFERIKKTIDN